eukprot:CAMPEP_0202872482 /NCGR_PEP_ID=MMETSP1391-20130828/21300_1 /ASSEMBLY_ACC=CAM_ASM_000867 /TAXON_ID=1034604 /ORGANISM="Chlamydomonas leiostraca, Strain SAG 11-49" /LENGTH=518 /DNA_ID=CAMNT_0049553531 /DNA_START=71 /DNA_END=1624 /DNA_ORIENTATION=+
MLLRTTALLRVGEVVLRQALPAATQLLHGLPSWAPMQGAMCTHEQNRGFASKQLSFHEKKRKALGLPPEETPSQPAITEQQTAVVVRPNEGPASVQQIANVLNHSALIITRPIEWGNVIFGYEQANRYTVYDQDGQPVAQLMEDYQGLANEVGRQLLRKRRAFTATVFSADGSQVIFRLRRPAYLINSTMFIEDGEGRALGEIRQRWHPLRRNYDMYLGARQFAAISGTFLAWEFELKDEKGGTLALIDRNFQGLGKEIFTDAGKYVIHFGAPTTHATAEEAQAALEGSAGADGGSSGKDAGSGSTPAIAASSAQPTGGAGAAADAPPSTAPAAPASGPPVTPLAQLRTGVAVIPTQSGNQLQVVRPLALDERMAVLAAAISVDYDYFSQHSHHGGGLVPPMFIPLPGSSPTPVPAGDPGAPPAGAAGAGAVGAEGAASAHPGSDGLGHDTAGGFGAGSAQGAAASSSPPGDMHLGGDEFNAPQGGPGPGEEMRWDLPEASAPGGGEAAEGAGGIFSA